MSCSISTFKSWKAHSVAIISAAGMIRKFNRRIVFTYIITARVLLIYSSFSNFFHKESAILFCFSLSRPQQTAKCLKSTGSLYRRLIRLNNMLQYSYASQGTKMTMLMWCRVFIASQDPVQTCLLLLRVTVWILADGARGHHGHNSGGAQPETCWGYSQCLQASHHNPLPD